MIPWLGFPLRCTLSALKQPSSSYTYRHIGTLVLGQRRCYITVHNSDKYDQVRSELEQALKVPQYFNFAKDVIEKWAKKKPNHTALHFTTGTEETLASYHKLYQEATALATSMSNPSPPKLALVILPKIFEWWVVNVAASWCGSVLSPGTTLLTASDVAHRISECGADCVICDANTAKKLDEVTKDVPLRIVVAKEDEETRLNWVRYDSLIKSVKGYEIKPCIASKSDDVAQIFFTSGTTGSPKMVPHTQGSYGIGHSVTCKYWLDASGDDVIWNISDTGWAKAAWSSLYVPMLVGATAFIHQMPSFDANEVLRSLSEYPVSILCAPPTAYRAMVQCGLDQFKFHSLRHCVSAGEPLNPEVIQQWTQSTGLKIFEGYGQTETTLLCAMGKGVDIRPGSMGKPAPGYTIKIVDEKWQELGPNEEGYFAVSLKESRPVGLFKGYVANENQTSEVFVGDYYLTGDKAYYDNDGYLWFVGRSDDVIISSGYRIGPFEVESALLEHPAVAESAAVSSPDSLRGEVVKAFVVLASDYKTQNPESLIKELQEHVKRTTAPYKYPRKVEFVEFLPKNISGKIRRVMLRKQEWEKT